MHTGITKTLATGCLALAIALAAQPGSVRRQESGASRWATSGRGGSATAVNDRPPPKLPTKFRDKGADESLASRRTTGGTAMVGGQVMAPGPVRLGSTPTLRSAIQSAGGETPFASLRRVRLIRGSEATEHDLTTREGLAVEVLDRDTIEVPQKTVFGR